MAGELSQQAESATQAESEVLDQAQAAPPAEMGAGEKKKAEQAQGSDLAALLRLVTLGLTIDQVVAILGQPQVVGDLGSKKTYFYGNMKVIFTDGKVTDVQ